MFDPLPFTCCVSTTEPCREPFVKVPVTEPRPGDFTPTRPLDLAAIIAPDVPPDADEVEPAAPLVLDFRGIENRDPIPLQFAHTDYAIGAIESFHAEGDRLLARGTLHQCNLASSFIGTTTIAGFPWATSIGLRLRESEIIKISAGDTATVNGRVLQGPILIASRWRLHEVSVTADPVDDTSFSIDPDHAHKHTRRSLLNIMTPSIRMEGVDAAPTFRDDLDRQYWIALDGKAAELVRYCACVDIEGDALAAVLADRYTFTLVLFCLAVGPAGRRAVCSLTDFRAGLTTDATLANATEAFLTSLTFYRADLARRYPTLTTTA